MKETAPYGTWPSPISASTVAANSVRLGEARWFDQGLFWLESRPQEGGRNALVMLKDGDEQVDVVPAPFSPRSRAHEYGGGAYTAWQDTVYFVEASDQQIYQMRIGDDQPRCLTQMPGCRFADLTISNRHQQLLAVCEEHAGQALPTTRLVTIHLNDKTDPKPVTTVAQGRDFYSSPTLSACGGWLCYLSWDHPNMPWDSTLLWLCPIDPTGNTGEARCIAGNGRESVAQPRFAPDGALVWVSDRSDWWNLYRLTPAQLKAAYAGEPVSALPMHPKAAEFATPQWLFGMSCYAFLDANTVLTAYSQQGRWQVALLRNAGEHASRWTLEPVASELCTAASVTAQGGQAALIGATPISGNALYYLHGNGLVAAHKAADDELNPKDVAAAEAVEFTSADGEACHAFLYRPNNARYQGPAGALPPLITLCHGGPTGATDTALNYKIQFWTNRGFAVLDVNYRGSTGYGRAYRQALQGQWGVIDVLDLAAAADFVTAQGLAHPQQRIIRGSSAGGYTVLAALTNTQAFNAGVSLYGIGDLEALARDTHKFEAHYLDGLIGPYPAAKAIYVERSPIHKVANIRCPVLVFQGLLDKVVPPNQAEAIVDAVRGQGLPVAYVTYADEAHGFRKAETIKHQLMAELYFYQRVFALDCSMDNVSGIDIINL